MTDWLWETKERAKQKERSINFRKPRKPPLDEEEEQRLAMQEMLVS